MKRKLSRDKRFLCWLRTGDSADRRLRGWERGCERVGEEPGAGIQMKNVKKKIKLHKNF